MRLLNLSPFQLSSTASPKQAARKIRVGRQTLLPYGMCFYVLSTNFMKCYSETNKSPVLLFSLLESPNFSIGKTSHIQPHFTSESMRQPGVAEGGRSGQAAAGGAGVRTPERLSLVMQAHISLHTYPTNENTTSACGAEKHWALLQ